MEGKAAEIRRTKGNAKASNRASSDPAAAPITITKCSQLKRRSDRQKKLSTTSAPDKHGACQGPLGHSGGGPPLDTCAQPAATPHPRIEGPGTPSDGAARSPELSFGARRRGAPSLGLGVPGFISISKLLRESTSKPVRT
ncbi:hypothetical protein AgCh_036773 [Apium graveolens]